MARTAVLGLPRVGPNRELKFALESFWAGKSGAEELDETARGLRRAGWERARAAGIDVIPSGDFSLLQWSFVGDDQPRRGRTRRSTRTCVIRSSTRSWSTSCAWTPT
jgi:hypothetical protein